jgi:hypothetical protein
VTGPTVAPVVSAPVVPGPVPATPPVSPVELPTTRSNLAPDALCGPMAECGYGEDDD